MKVPMHKIIMYYQDLNPQGHWFDRDTMRFFKCRLPDFGYAKDNQIYFISSESDNFRGRKYTIRRLDRITGEIDNASEFYSMGKGEAKRFLAYNILGWKIKDL